ncbi:unnamed protein product [Peronospora belbahrii]|uniref:MYND-type domain-containing protein n=1 Tax=Peronospora belbahrii TaxID=622444 RepID=A0ABN8D7U2_9STRA|nr:unnamed protein product [Peronospora belbahrii]
MAKTKDDGSPSIETLASGAIAAGCLQAIMSMVHPELVKFVLFQKERVARSNARLERSTSRYFRKDREISDTSDLNIAQQNDLSYQLKYLRQHWHSHLRYYGLDPALPTIVQRALMFRNKVSHQNQLTLTQYKTAIATFEKLADIIECNALIRRQIRELVTKLLSFSPLNTREAVGDTKTSTTQVKDHAEITCEETESKLVFDLTQARMIPPPASLDQILQQNYLYDGDEEEYPLWMDLKLIGNDYYNEKNYTEAIEAYSQGLDVAPNQAVLFGNRAMCYLRLNEFERAREDAEDAIDADKLENVKYYRLLSEAIIGMKDYDEVKKICEQGLKLKSTDATLLSRKRTAETMIAKEKSDHDLEKKRLQLEERAKVKQVNAAVAANSVQVQLRAGKHKLTKTNNKQKNAAPEMELVPMLEYQEVPSKWIETHSRGSQRLKMYQQGSESLVVAAKILLQVTSSIGTPRLSKLQLDKLVKEGMANLRKAGKAGIAEAWFCLGVLYSSDVRKCMPLKADPHKMLECFQKAAELRPFIKPPGNRVFSHQGVAEAENELGVCYRDGKPASVVDVDLEKAFHYFLRSAEHDYPIGQYHVAIAYATGSGTPVDAFAARMWTSRAAQHGLPAAQHYLAELFEKGYGGKRDVSQAQEWTLAACQSRLSGLLLKHDFADNGITASGSGKIDDQFLCNSTILQRGKAALQEFYSAYLDKDRKDNGAEFGNGSDGDDDKLLIAKVTSLPLEFSSSFDIIGMYRPPSAVIDAEIQSRAQAGGITAWKYLASKELLGSAAKLLALWDFKGALRDLKKADLMWEWPKGALAAATSTDLLPKILKEAAVSLQINPRDIDAAYVIGRWQMMSSQDDVCHWRRCAKMHPNEASFRFYLGAAYLTMQRYDDALVAMEAALAIQKKPDWLYWFAAPMIGLGLIEPAMSIYKEYVNTNPPDERFIPDAYYSIGALYFKQRNNAMATVYHELGQMAESVTIRFPAFYPSVLYDIPKETLRSGMKMNGFMESSVIAKILAQNMADCGFCKATIKVTQLLGHKLSKCPRRAVACQDCSEHMVFDLLQTHRLSRHAASGVGRKKKAKEERHSQNTVAGLSLQQTELANTALRQSDGLQDLVAPKFHFVGTILDITRGKSTQTVFTLETIFGQRWTLRVNCISKTSRSNAAVALSKAIEGAEVTNSVLVFWRLSPPLEMIDQCTVAIPMQREVYGQDVVLYVLKCSAQGVGFELCQLRHNKYIGNGLLCTSCGNPNIPAKSLLACGACKMVKYCSRNCQRMHWKGGHRHMCQDAAFFNYCTTMSEDITPPGLQKAVGT